jgi:hypothetical protein
MGNKSPKATSKQAAQKKAKAKANAANQKKKDAASAKQVSKEVIGAGFVAGAFAV